MARDRSGKKPNAGDSQIRCALEAATIALAVFVVIGPALWGGWIWDDVLEVIRNPTLRDANGLRRAWLTPSGPDYYPVKTTIQWLEWHVFGDRPAGYHVVTACFHLLGSLLVWRLLARLGVRLAWLAGLVFAVHPMAVESVAWMSEQKNTLSLPFLLGAMICYGEFDSAREGGARSGVRRSPAKADPQRADSAGDVAQRVRDNALHLYWWSIGLFLAAMLSKSSVVMFPIVILLYAWWKRGSVGRRDLFASLPFFVISLGLGLVTYWFQRHVAIDTERIEIGGPLSRLAGAGLALGFYLVKAVVPVGLMPVYPRWAVDPPSLAQFLPWLALGSLAALLWAKRESWGRPLLFGLGFFAINLLPVLGFVTMSFMRIAAVSDHFVYVSLIGIAGLAAAGAGWIDDALRPALRPVAWVAGGVVFIGLLVEGPGYARVFASSEALWTFAIAKNPGSATAHNNLAIELAKDPVRSADAIVQYKEALRLKPEYAEAHSNLAIELAKNPARRAEAIAQYEEAMRLKPDFAEGHNNLGNLLAGIPGRLPEAIAHFEEALRLEPDFAEARNDLGRALAQVPGRSADAIAQYGEALRLKPDYAEAHNNLGLALAGIPGREAEAISQYEAALRLRPDYAEAHSNLAVVLAGIPGHAEEAMAQNEAALRLAPNLAEAHNNLGLELAQMPGRASDSIAQYESALRLKPDYAEAHNNLANELAEIPGRLPEAIEHYEAALRLEPGLVQAHYNVALAYGREGRLNEAIRHLEIASRLDPANAEIRETLEKARATRP